MTRQQQDAQVLRDAEEEERRQQREQQQQRAQQALQEREREKEREREQLRREYEMQRAELQRRQDQQQQEGEEMRRNAVRQQRALPANPEMPPGYEFDEYAPPPSYVSNDGAAIRGAIAERGPPEWPPEPMAATAPVFSERPSAVLEYDAEICRLGLPAECWACEEKLVWLEMPERPGQQKDPYCVCDRCGTVSSAGGVVRDGDELLGVVLSTMSAGVV